MKGDDKVIVQLLTPETDNEMNKLSLGVNEEATKSSYNPPKNMNSSLFLM